MIPRFAPGYLSLAHLNRLVDALNNLGAADGSLLVTSSGDAKLFAVNPAYFPDSVNSPSFDPTAISGYDPTKQQILTHSSGTLAWVTLAAEESTSAFECPT
jgi:hypothetical protein